MKKQIFTLLIFIFILSGFAVAHHDQSVLMIRLFDNSPVIAEIGGMPSSAAATPLSVTHVAPGQHFLNVYQITGRSRRHQSKRLVFQGFIEIPPGAQVQALIDHRFRLRIENTIPLYSAPGHMPGHPFPHMPMECPMMNPVLPGGHYNHWPQQSPQEQAMPAADFQDLRRLMMHTPFDNTRLTIARQAVSNSWITSVQVAELMRLFTFESNKLNFAKFAYDNVSDKQRFFVIYESFTFSASIHEMDRFIAGR